MAWRRETAQSVCFHSIGISWYNPSMSTISYLDRLLEPVTESFTPEVARALVNLRTDAETEAHISILRQKANEGTLSPEEEDEYKEFVEAVDIISLIQMKARQFLARHSAKCG